MKIVRTVIIIIVSLLFLFCIAGIYKIFFSFTIAPSPVILDQTRLMDYLGEGGLFTIPLRYKEDNGNYTYINSLAFTLFKNKPLGNAADCIAPSKISGPMFCFTESSNNGQMIVNIYSDETIVQENSSARVNQLLNFNLLPIFENRLGISAAKENSIFDQPPSNYLFIWR